MPKNNSLLETVNLLSELVVFETYDFSEFLKKLIKLILKCIPANSCLIYFYDAANQELILTASKKPHGKLLGKIKMRPGEGITGWVAEHKKTVVLKKEAYKDSRFKQFKELPEDKYEAFLSVPIIDKSGVVGVINIQNIKSYDFQKEQIEILEAMVKIISSAFQKIVLERRVFTLQSKLEDRKTIDKAKGILMNKDNLSEKEAYAILRKESMKKRKSMREIADAVLLVWG